MKRGLFLLLAVSVVLMLAVGLSAKNLDTKGKAWLDAHSEAAAINVNGNWHAKEWGKIVLNQSRGQQRLDRKRRRLGHHGCRQRQASLPSLFQSRHSCVFRRINFRKRNQPQRVLLQGIHE